MAKFNPQAEARDVKTLVKAFFAAADRMAAEYRATIIKAGLAQISAEVKLQREKLAAQEAQAAQAAKAMTPAKKLAKVKKAVTAKKVAKPDVVAVSTDADADKTIATVTKVRAGARERKARTNGTAAPHESIAA